MAKAKLQGTVEIPFSTLVRETIEVHGIEWTKEYYTAHGLPAWQWAIFAGLPNGLGADTAERLRVWVSAGLQAGRNPREMLMQMSGGCPWETHAHL
jgi:hypothetical protein